MRCSSDLRKRLVDFVRSGGSKAEAAPRFTVGEASAYRWPEPVGLEHKRPRDALRAALTLVRAKEMEKKHWEGYRRKPVRKREFSVWEAEQVWSE